MVDVSNDSEKGGGRLGVLQGGGPLPHSQEKEKEGKESVLPNRLKGRQK